MTELVKVENNQVVASSRVVAENFGKNHQHVMESIRNLTAKNPTVKNMFYKSTYINDRGREYPEYLMTRDGFTLLAMGFTGSKAIQFKLEYIEAFNRMEQARQQPKLPTTYKEALLALVEAEEVKETMAEQLALAEPKLQALDSLTGNTDTLHTTTQIATNYGISAIKMNKLLHQLCVQYKQTGVWKLYAKYEGQGYTATPTRETEDGYVYKTMLWTPKGEYFLYNLLKELGYTSTTYDLMFKEQ